jgi:hypothetical protein
MQSDPFALLARDLTHALVRGVIRQELWNVLRQIGLVTDPEPPAPTAPPRSVILETFAGAGLGHLLSSPPDGPLARP